MSFKLVLVTSLNDQGEATSYHYGLKSVYPYTLYYVHNMLQKLKYELPHNFFVFIGLNIKF